MIGAMKERTSRRLAAVMLIAALMLPVLLSSAALAGAPVGACCLVGGGCDDLMSFTCEDQGGTFLGDGTSCSETACDRSLAAPLLSIFGLVSAVGSLVGLGLYRLLFRRR
jgi:hypothetical protein